MFSRRSSMRLDGALDRRIGESATLLRPVFERFRHPKLTQTMALAPWF